MSILDELKELRQQRTKPTPTTNDSYISDAVTNTSLYNAGCDEQVIRDVLLEPVESRGDWIKYFETVGKKYD